MNPILIINKKKSISKEEDLEIICRIIDNHIFLINIEVMADSEKFAIIAIIIIVTIVIMDFIVIIIYIMVIILTQDVKNIYFLQNRLASILCR